ncbi:hypothetical protein D3C81_1738180 [compost metagenome]
MYTINVVATDNLHHGIYNVLARFRDAGIYIQFAVCLDDPFRMKLSHMIRGQPGKCCRTGVRCCPERVEPGMNLHAPLMRRADHVLQRIIAGCLSLRSRQHLGPGNQL